MKTFWTMTTLAACCVPCLAFADESYPRLTGAIAIELEDDYTFNSDDPTAEVNDIYTTTEAALALEFSPDTSLNATLLLEPVIDASPNEDRFFNDHGFYAEELYLSHDFGSAAVILGKFDPAYGFAWDVAPGIYGVDFAEDYELTERLGFAVEVPFQYSGTEGAFSIAAYAADRTFLSNSLFEERGEIDASDGGVSNTDAPESFVASVYAETEGVLWNVGLRRQAKGAGDTHDEYGVVAGATTVLEGSEVDLLGEVAFFPNFDGGADSAFYGTVGVGAPVGPFYLSGVYALREVQNAPTDHLATVTAEYEIAENAAIGVGYRYGHEGGDDNHTVGAVFVYEFGF